MTRDKNHVGKQWRKWNEKQRSAFNAMFAEIRTLGPDSFLHPTTVGRQISASEFRTIAWNAAWLTTELFAN